MVLMEIRRHRRIFSERRKEDDGVYSVSLALKKSNLSVCINFLKNRFRLNRN